MISLHIKQISPEAVNLKLGGSSHTERIQFPFVLLTDRIKRAAGGLIALPGRLQIHRGRSHLVKALHHTLLRGEYEAKKSREEDRRGDRGAHHIPYGLCKGWGVCATDL